jgi:hypothetical protein
MSRLLRSVAAGAAILIASCGGGSNDGETDYVLNASPGGIWHGTDQVTGLTILALVDELGHFTLIRADGVQFTGLAVTAGTSLYASIEGVTEFGKTFPDGSIHGSGTLTGDVTARQEMDIDAQFTTDAGTGAHILVPPTPQPFQFDVAYNESSSLAIIAANYADAVTGTVVTINSNGDIFAQDANTGCVINGRISIIEETYNVYDVQVSYANCQGATAALNGIPFAGLVALGDTMTPQQLVGGVTGSVNGRRKYSIVYALDRLSPGSP